MYLVDSPANRECTWAFIYFFSKSTSSSVVVICCLLGIQWMQSWVGTRRISGCVFGIAIIFRLNYISLFIIHLIGLFILRKWWNCFQIGKKKIVYFRGFSLNGLMAVDISCFLLPSGLTLRLSTRKKSIEYTNKHRFMLSK